MRVNIKNYKLIKVEEGEDCCINCIFNNFYKTGECEVSENDDFDCVTCEGYFIEVKNDKKWHSRNFIEPRK